MVRCVGDATVGEQDHRRHVFHGEAKRLEGAVEAVGRGVGGDHRHRALAVPAEHGLQQVGLLDLGRQSGRRAAALHVDDHQRQFDHHRQAHGLRLERHAGARRGGEAQRPAERRADGRADAGDLVLGLERGDVEMTERRERVEDVGCRRDGIRAQEEPEARQLGGGHEAERGGLVAGDAAVGAR